VNAPVANTTLDKVRDLQDKLYQAAKRSPTRPSTRSTTRSIARTSYGERGWTSPRTAAP